MIQIVSDTFMFLSRGCCYAMLVGILWLDHPIQLLKPSIWGPLALWDPTVSGILAVYQGPLLNFELCLSFLEPTKTGLCRFKRVYLSGLVVRKSL